MTRPKGYPDTPELDKQHKAIEERHSQELGEFLDWLRDEKGYVIAQYPERSDFCFNCEHEEPHTLGPELPDRCTYEDEAEECDCRTRQLNNPDRLFPVSLNMERLLADYFRIDYDKAEEEKRSVLAWVRKQNAN